MFDLDAVGINVMTTRPGGTPSLGTPKGQALLRPGRCLRSECIQRALFRNFRISYVLYERADQGRANREQDKKWNATAAPADFEPYTAYTFVSYWS